MTHFSWTRFRFIVDFLKFLCVILIYHFYYKKKNFFFCWDMILKMCHHWFYGFFFFIKIKIITLYKKVLAIFEIIENNLPWTITFHYLYWTHEIKAKILLFSYAVRVQFKVVIIVSISTKNVLILDSSKSRLF